MKRYRWEKFLLLNWCKKCFERLSKVHYQKRMTSKMLLSKNQIAAIVLFISILLAHSKMSVWFQKSRCIHSKKCKKNVKKKKKKMKENKEKSW